MAQMESKLLEIEIEPGTASKLSPLLRRVTAPNPSVMTGPGTNSYIVGNKELAVIDPGPSISSHVSALLGACEGAKLRWIIVTHTHPDHSPAAMLLAEATGAELIGATIEDDGHQDTSFKADRELSDGDLFSNDEFTLRAVHTPGHVGNHYCFFLEEEKTLFTGDHIMQGTTVVVIPPSGDMAEYLHSLEKLKELHAEFLAPAHGHVMLDAESVIQGLIDHRMAREAKVLAAFERIASGTLEQLLPLVYDDVDPKVLPVAKIALWSHLLKLETDGRAQKHAAETIDREVWTLLC
ncbi:MBL fold metallo-hydrolase [uncultured Pseudoteredinibacter sp.]|uniref:MBL fold metallo-hydrolase n=1 Tax=uncultured Pseudoteredinibacter sp. TaxID=1641701 RepID=UPI002612348E|nr:MBL fold metallo-hydrolase [uncultured Pseudoteredinibacter sp.]